MPPAPDKTRLGILLCLFALFMFSSQDAMTKILIRDYDAAQFVMVRFWVFALFATALAAKKVGIKAAAYAKRPFLQIGRCVLLIVEIAVFATGLRYLGLADMHATFATFPLMATAMAPFLLGEKVGWRRWSAVVVGFIGAVIIIRPGMTVFQPVVLIPLVSALMFALYHIMTRLGSQSDSAYTSLFYLGWVGALASTPFGIMAWKPPTSEAWIFMAALSVTGLIGHMLLILALEYAPASTLQPLNYILLVWATLMGYVLFHQLPDGPTLIGGAVIVSSGLFVMFRERIRKRERDG
jgi:drug/metabolite transporter (DMT)-like permease